MNRPAWLSLARVTPPFPLSLLAWTAAVFSTASAAPQLSVTPITWNVVGLDSNKPTTEGPDTFPVGARVCNTGDMDATNVTATFRREGAINPYITLNGFEALTAPLIPFGPPPAPSHQLSSTPVNCFDYYFNITLARNKAAVGTRQPYHIDVTAANAVGVRTPTNREIYIQNLVSQNRNGVTSFTGPTAVTVGGIYTYDLVATTAPGGYPQLETFPVFPNNIYQVLNVNSRYSMPSGAVNSTVYADACGWVNDTTSRDYMNNGSCNLPDLYPGGKVGDTINSRYSVRILGPGTNSIINYIIDYSGNSYHYESNAGTATVITATAYNPPDLAISKTHAATSFTAGTPFDFTLTVSNAAGPNIERTTSLITVLDTLPAGLAFVGWSGSGWSCSANGQTVTCTTSAVIHPGASAPPITITTNAAANGAYTNTATVTHTASGNPRENLDANPANNTATDEVLVGGRIAGRVFEDSDSLGDPFAAGDQGRPNVTVRVFRDNGDRALDPATDRLISTVQTDATGNYSAPVDAPHAAYWVTVNSREVTPVGGYNTNFTQGDVWAEQVSQCHFTGGTFRCDRRFGGQDPGASDQFGTRYDHVARADVSTTNVNGIDFGFSFNVVTNTRGGDASDDDTTANRSVQGSLRQFLQNANAIRGANSLRFVPAVPANVTLGSDAYWRVSVTSALPAITDVNTTVDGTARRTSDGGTTLDTNPGRLGYQGSVGTGPDGVSGSGDEGQLLGVARPELEVSGTSSVPTGFDVQANTAILRHLSILGFGSGPNNDAHANIRIGAVSGTLIEHNIIGSRASAFQCPSSFALSGADNIRSVGGSNGTVQSNLIGCAAGKGFGFKGNSGNWTVQFNEIRGNGIGNSNLDGIDIESGSANVNVYRNFIAFNEGAGVDNFQSGNAAGGNVIRENTITNNGYGAGSNAETPGVRLYTPGNIVVHNLIFENYGAGVMLTPSANGTTISQNSMHGNGTIPGKAGNAASGQLGIDLHQSGDDPAKGTFPFVTLNAPSSTRTGANGLLNYPVFISATISGSSLIVTGYARPGSSIELFVAASDPTGFGEGRTYLGTFIEGSAADEDSSSCAYNMPGVTCNVTLTSRGSVTSVGADNTHRFRFAVPLSNLKVTVNLGEQLTATASCFTANACTMSSNGSTSEFGNFVIVTGTPNVSLTKQVRNCGPLNPVSAACASSAQFGSQASAKPGDVLEYCIAYANTGNGAALNFSLQDAIIATTEGLIDGYGAGMGVEWTNGTTTLQLTSVSGDDQAQLSATTLGFTLPSLGAGAGGTVCFRALIK